MKHRLSLAISCALLASTLQLSAQDDIQHVVGGPNNEVRLVNGYPEYWVDGKPFIMHAAAFFYHRLPRDRWAEELQRLAAMGVNTIDVYPFWNWHQPEEKVYDFDGHTNPRRDLKYLLQLTQELGFKVTFRPGPYFTAEWRNGGYPDWLLRRADYKMSEQAILESRYPRLSALQYDKSDDAAAGYLANPTHLRYAREWFKQVLGVAEPHLTEHGGNILNIQIDDDQAIGPENFNGPNFWKYMDTLRGFAREATRNSDLPYYINGADMRLNAESNDLPVAPFWNTGQDYQMSGPGGYSNVSEAAKNKFTVDNLKTQPLFPPSIIEYGPGWRLNEKDTFETPSHDPSNLLMGSRVFFQNGLKGLNYYSLNDTVYPAGYEAPWANYFYAREGAVDYTGTERAPASYAHRNGRLVRGVGALLGATHFLPDAAIVYSMAAFQQAELTSDEANFVADSAKRIAWSGVYEHYNFELIDSDHTPEKNFKRYRLLLLFDPAAGEQETGKLFPHLHEWSLKSQQMVEQYLDAGGTVLLFPTIPKGEIFDRLFAKLGPARSVREDSEIKFSDGRNAKLLGYRTIVAPNNSSPVEIFARDSQGQPIGAGFEAGKGRVFFFGGDFSLWSESREHQGSAPSVQAGQNTNEAEWKLARMVLPALMREAGVTSKVSVDPPTSAAQDAGIYATELISDAGSLPFEKRSPENTGYAFAGITNLSPQQSYVAKLTVTDPRAPDLASSRPERNLQLPQIALPPRESVMLPIRVPLNEIVRGSQLPVTDEIYYATAELTHVAYDANLLSLDFTAPMDGEVALRLSQRPQSSRVDGQTAQIHETGSFYRIEIPKGDSPDFRRRVEVTYPLTVPSLHFVNGRQWLSGSTNDSIVRVENPGPAAIQGELEFSAPAFQFSQHIPVNVQAHASSQVIFRLNVPAEAPSGLVAELNATLRRGTDEVAAVSSGVIVHSPITASVEALPGVVFPLREDQTVPVVRPALASVNLPGAAKFQVRLKNWSGQTKEVSLAATGHDLEIVSTASRTELPPGSEKLVEVTATPLKGTGLYHLSIKAEAVNFEFSEDVSIAAVSRGEALAYSFDYDRDGFDDVILENQDLRCFVSPHAGGRSFAFVRKDTSSNAFDSVGGMRDNFTTRVEPADMHGLPDWTTEKWLGLYNRPYSFQLISTSGKKAEVQLEYEAPDIYPAGIHLKRALSLSGDQDMLVESTSITPHGTKKPQALVLESSVPFRIFDHPNYNQWFAEGRPALDFESGKKIDLAGSTRFIGTHNRINGETFTAILLSKPRALQIVPEAHSALFRFIYPNFAHAGQTYTYTVGYLFEKQMPTGP